MTALAPPPATPHATVPEPASRTTRVLELQLADGGCRSATVDAVRDQVAEAELEAEGLAVGSVAEARLWVKGLGRPLSALVRVVWRNESAGGARYGLALPALGHRGGALTAALCAVFNRRSSHRVRPEPLAPPWVVLETEQGARAGGPLGDISLGGLSLQVGAEAESLLAGVENVRLSVQLPSGPRPVQAMARIRSRRLAGNRVRYGLAFDGGAATRAAVLDYVRARREDCLRRARRTAEPELL